MRSRAWILLLGGLLLACSDSVGIEEVTEVSFSVSAEEVEPGALFGATLAIKNLSLAPIKLESGMGCISYLAVDEAPYGDPVTGTGFSCLAVSSTYRLRPGETLSWSWDLAAELESGQALEPGEYHLNAVLNVIGLHHPSVTFSVAGER